MHELSADLRGPIVDCPADVKTLDSFCQARVAENARETRDPWVMTGYTNAERAAAQVPYATVVTHAEVRRKAFRESLGGEQSGDGIFWQLLGWIISKL